MMDYTHLLKALGTASLFDLYRMNTAIANELNNPERLDAIKQQLRLGMALSYFEAASNRLHHGKLVEMRQKNAVVLDEQQNKRLLMPYYMLNMAQVDTAIHQQGEPLTANNLQVGDCVGFSKNGQDIIGFIKRRNQKTVTLITAANERWRVAYTLLYRVHEGASVNDQSLPHVKRITNTVIPAEAGAQ